MILSRVFVPVVTVVSCTINPKSQRVAFSNFSPIRLQHHPDAGHLREPRSPPVIYSTHSYSGRGYWSVLAKELAKKLPKKLAKSKTRDHVMRAKM